MNEWMNECWTWRRRAQCWTGPTLFQCVYIMIRVSQHCTLILYRGLTVCFSPTLIPWGAQRIFTTKKTVKTSALMKICPLLTLHCTPILTKNRTQGIRIKNSGGEYSMKTIPTSLIQYTYLRRIFFWINYHTFYQIRLHMLFVQEVLSNLYKIYPL